MSVETKRNETKPTTPLARGAAEWKRQRAIIVRAALAANPTLPFKTIARTLADRRPDLFPSIESARAAVRWVAGSSGEASRQYRDRAICAGPTTLGEASETKPIEYFLRKQITMLRTEIASLKERLGSREETMDRLRDAVREIEPPKVRLIKPQPRSKPKVSAVLLLGDWHIGEIIRGSEVEFSNRFNWKAAQAGIERIVSAFIKWVICQRGAYAIDHCAIIGLGDWISGEIREELRANAEFPTPVQVARAGSLLSWAVATVAAHFSHVDFWEVGADNHGRLTPKPVAKRKAEYNMGYLTYALAELRLRSLPNVVCISSPGMKMMANINGWRFLCEHGDTVRAWMGVPWYGIQREVGREAIRRMNRRRFDYVVTGHWHTPVFLENRVIVNGALTGTTEYDHSAGRFAAPCQVGFLVDTHHGVFAFTPFHRLTK